MSAAIHATAVAVHGGDGWRGALLRGASGAGKSDLTLRLMARGWRLVGDDYVHLWASMGRVYAAPAANIAGQIEARGLGLIATAHRSVTRIVLVVDCVQTSVERMPEPAEVDVDGIALARLELDIRPSSAIETVSLAIRRL